MSDELAQIIGNCAQLSSIGIAVINTDGVITYANPAFCEMLLIPAPVGCLLVEHLSSRFHSISADLSQTIACNDMAIIELRPERGSELLTLHIAAGEELRMLTVDRIAKPAMDSDSQKNLAYIDPLTGLGNRQLLSEVTTNWQPKVPRFYHWP